MRIRVLVVDDDPAIRDLLDLALSDLGYEVIGAEDGQVGLALAGQMAPDVILLDLRMPVLDGWAFARAYREQPGRHAPIIVFTAGREAAAGAAPIQADGYLDKPFRVGDLVACVAAFGRAGGSTS